MQTLKNKLAKLSLQAALVGGFIGLLIVWAPFLVSARPISEPPAPSPAPSSPSPNPNPPPPSSSPCDKKSPTAGSLHNCLKQNPIIKDINTAINFLSAGAAIIIVGSIIVGGIQYSLAGNNPSSVTAAKKRIADALIALFAFFFIWGFLQWLVPGGLLFK